MGVKKKPTLKILFRQFAISLIVMLVAAIIVPFGLEGLAINAGLATRANLSELQVKEIFHGTKRLEKRMSIKNLNCVFESTK